jgi:hypothetical protein
VDVAGGAVILLLFPEPNRNVKLRTPLAYFQAHFCGMPMRDGWVPPQISLRAPSARAKDFVSWCLAAPVISDRARRALEPLIGPHVEFLPLLELDRVQYWAVNVLGFVDCLDRDSSEVVYSPDDGRPMNILSYRFVPERLTDVPVFKVSEASAVLVRQQTAAAVWEAGLTGVRFADPGANLVAESTRGGPIDMLNNPVASRRTRR